MKRILLVVLCALGLFALSAAGAAAKPGQGRNGFSGTFQCSAARAIGSRNCSGTFTQTDPDTGQPITITIDVIGFLPHGRR